MKRIFLLAACLAMFSSAHAYNITIDFEELPLDGDYTPGPDPIVSKGFSFTGLHEKGITDWPLGAVDESRVLHWCAIDDYGFCPEGDTLYMTQSGLATFDLQSLELARSDTNVDVQLTGFYSGGGSISTTFLVDSQSLTTFNLGAGWTDLESVRIDPLAGGNGALAIDNIAVVSEVPLPAAAYLFASGIGLLGWIRRRAERST